ncbi:MAG: mRNA surveillance protein pelota [Candidatus Bathyarchaeota archaeon]
MKIIEYDEKKGLMKVIPENIDDLWVLYNVIRQEDYVFARTSREIKIDQEAARPTKGKRIAISLGVCVEKISFESSDKRVRVNGTIIEAPEEFALMGSYHTINITLQKPVTVFKKEWRSYDITRIERATREINNPFIIVSVDDEKGCVALLCQYGIELKAEIEARLPGKLEIEKRGVTLAKYFNSLLKELVLIWNENHGLIAVVGPGFWKEIFVKQVKEKQPDIFKDISAIGTVGSSGSAGIEEALRSGILDGLAKKIRIIEETRAVEELLSRLGSQRRDVTYGLENVKNAISNGAVDLFLIADALLRIADDESRRGMEDYLRDVEKMRGRVMIVNAENEAGKKLLSLGGVAALLRFGID